ncbi:hypothetical protein M758_3G045900 [Ceratodon purpureus]|nr:hypothetical protein M758_3G045900 [Ceratodon purpureus]
MLCVLLLISSVISSNYSSFAGRVIVEYLNRKGRPLSLHATCNRRDVRIP